MSEDPIPSDQKGAPNLSVAPEPWGYNPSSWPQRLAVAAIAVPAVVISFYLGLYQMRVIDLVWDPFFGSQSMQVLDSEVSHAMRRWTVIPDALLGCLAYLGDIVFALAGSTRRWQYRPWLVVLFGIDVIPLGIVSAVLVFLQGAVVGSWCFLCIVTAVISLTLVYFAYDEVFSGLLYLREVWRRSRSLAVLWKAFLGYPSEVGEEAARAISGIPAEDQ